MSDRPDPNDDQFVAEELDGDMIDDADFPPDQPLGVSELLEKDTTAVDFHAVDSLEERLKREEPDRLPPPEVDPKFPGQLIDPDDPFGPDLTKELVGDAGGGMADDAVAEVLSDAPDAITSEGWAENVPAEEAAIHVIEERNTR